MGKTFIAFLTMWWAVMSPSFVRSQVTIQWVLPDTVAQPGSLIHLNVRIQNVSTDTLTMKPQLEARGMELIGSIPVRIQLAPHGQLLLPVQMYIPRQTPADSAAWIVLKLLNEETVWRQERLLIKIARKPGLRLELLSSELFVRNPLDPVAFTFRCRNTGNTRETIRISISGLNSRQQEIVLPDFVLGDGKDTLIRFRKKIPELLEVNQTRLRITAMNLDSSLIVLSYIKLFSGNSSQNLYAHRDHLVDDQRMMAIYNRYTGQPMQYQEYIWNGGFSAGGLGGQFRLNLKHYENGLSGAQWVFANSGLDLQIKNARLQLGNVYYAGEMSASGMGATLALGSAQKGRLQAGWINHQYNMLTLFQQGHNSLSGQTGFLDFSKKWHPQWGTKTIFNYSRDIFSHSQTVLAGNTFLFTTKNKLQSFSMGAFGSQKMDWKGGVNTVKPSQLGGAITLNYSGQVGQWVWESDHYWSSADYGGSNRGRRIWDQRLSFRDWTWIRYYKTKDRPGNDFTTSPYRFIHDLETVELGFHFKMGSQTQILIKPYFYREGFGLGQESLEQVSLSSSRVLLNLAKMGINNRSFQLQAEGGWIHKATVANFQKQFAFKLSGAYHFGALSFQTQMQQGPFYASEMWIYRNNDRQYASYGFMPGIHYKLFKKRVDFFASYRLSYENHYERWVQSLQSKAALTLPRHWVLSVGYDQYQYGQTFGMHNLDIGLAKRFPKKNVTSGSSLLDLRFFEDLNHNGFYEKGEPPASGLMISINEAVFFTDAGGQLIYKGLPKGTYQIRLIQAPYLAMAVQTVQVDGRTKMTIPLQKLERIEGHLILRKDTFSFKTDENLAGIRIHAVHEGGNTYSGYTDDLGQFVLFGPFGRYTISVDATTLADKYTRIQEPQVTILLPGKPLQLTFEIAVKKRNVQIIRFGSISQKDGER